MYYSGYSDDEIIRWTGKLYRHYCIEGSRDRLSRDPLELPHIVNPDFGDGAKGWQIDAAEKDSVEPKTFEGFGVLQARWGGSSTDSFMWMRRSSTKPNKVSQTIKGLTPGRLYSLTMFSSDYGDLINGQSQNKWPTVRIDLEGVELLEGPRVSFTHPFPHSYGRTQGAFSPTHQYWNQFHRQVFRATASAATLTISDWKNEEVPGGPVGQESAFNYVQVRPYLEE